MKQLNRCQKFINLFLIIRSRMKKRIPMIKQISGRQSDLAKEQNRKSVKFEENPIRSTSIEYGHRRASILKNKRSSSGYENHRMRSTSINSMGGFNPKNNQGCQNFTVNKVVKEQYNRLLQKHSAQFKFTDEIFPPHISSLFTYANRTINKNTKIKWKRITQIFPNRDLILMSSDPLRNFIRPSTQMGKEYFCTALNCIKNNKSLLKRIFQLSRVNVEGIYCLKIFQHNVWKNIIIDDYIPVIQENDKKGIQYKPLFSTGEVTKNKSQPIQIWSYLLEKAYAKLYQTYQALTEGNVWDCIEELSNENYEQVNVQTTTINLKQMFRRSELIILGDHVDGKLTPVFSAIGMSDRIYFLSPNKPGFKSIIKPQNLHQNFTFLYVFGLSKYSYTGFCPIKQVKQSISVRTFAINNPQKCTLTVTQKDQKCFRGKVKYEYSWVRMILLQKQFHDGFRWIDGKYGQFKSIFMELTLPKGQYYLLIMPQWSKRPYDLNLFIRSRMPIEFDRKQFKDQILEQGCSDLAQRFGKMNQLNAYICSYNCIHEDLGLIVENINNQKPIGNIKVMRSFHELEASLPIQPLNKQFKDKKNLQIMIKANCQFTVVLMMKGGLDREFFQNFDFGCD